MRGARIARACWTLVGLATLVALLAGTGVSRGATAPAVPRTLQAGGGKIAFVRPGPENNPEVRGDGLYLANADGSSVIRLVSGRKIYSPAWSPDGRKIAFSCQLAICVVGADGRGLKRLTKPKFCNPPHLKPMKTWDWYPTWSPDGRRIAFERRCEPPNQPEYLLNPNIYVMNANGTRQRRLFPHAGMPAWAPAGGKIALFVPTAGANWGKLVVRNASGAPAQVLDAGGVGASRPAWSPGGQQLAFEAYWPDSDSEAVWTMSAGGGTRQFVAEGGRPSYSPDGKRLVYEEIDFNSNSLGFDALIYVVNADGSGRSYMTRGSEPAWQPR